MGVVHVLTGPDHLSAIATLSVNVGNCRAFYYGVQWGVGHSIGLIVVGSIFIVLENRHYHLSHDDDDDNDDDPDGNEHDDDGSDDDIRSIQIPERVENISVCFVGIFMLVLGSFSLFKAYRKRRDEMRSHQQHDVDDEKRSSSTDPLIINTAGIVNYSEDNSSEIGPISPESHSMVPMGVEDQYHSFHHAEHINNEKDNEDEHGGHGHNHLPVDMKDGVSKQVLSLCIGIVHGVAGPGGVLGVIPAVRLHNVWHSIVYLGSFCASSILVMGCFAASYGTLSSRLTQSNGTLAYRMELFSASLSFTVGFALLYFGKVQDIFT